MYGGILDQLKLRNEACMLPNNWKVKINCSKTSYLNSFVIIVTDLSIHPPYFI